MNQSLTVSPLLSQGAIQRAEDTKAGRRHWGFHLNNGFEPLSAFQSGASPVQTRTIHPTAGNIRRHIQNPDPDTESYLGRMHNNAQRTEQRRKTLRPGKKPLEPSAAGRSEPGGKHSAVLLIHRPKALQPVFLTAGNAADHRNENLSLQHGQSPSQAVNSE